MHGIRWAQQPFEKISKAVASLCVYCLAVGLAKRGTARAEARREEMVGAVVVGERKIVTPAR
jgi:hypothetical protein